LLSFNPKSKKVADISTIVLDCSQCTQKSLSSFISNQDTGSNTLHSAGLVNLRIHALASGYDYNIRTHQVQKKTVPTILSDESRCKFENNDLTIPLASQVTSIVKEIENCNQ
jgi:hypothetical protein